MEGVRAHVVNEPEAAVGLWPPPPAAVATGMVGDAGLGRRRESVMFMVAEEANRQPCC